MTLEFVPMTAGDGPDDRLLEEILGAHAKSEAGEVAGAEGCRRSKSADIEVR